VSVDKSPKKGLVGT